MSEKEIAMNIVLKMHKTEDNNQKHLETVCNAYKIVYQAVIEDHKPET